MIDYCTNLDEILKETGLDLRDRNQKKQFDTLYTLPKSSEPIGHKDKYRYVKFGKKYAIIDEQIADLIIKLNKNGHKTMYCCCGHEGNSVGFRTRQFYIAFEFSKNTYDLLSRVYKSLTGCNSEKYSKRYINVKSRPLSKYDKLILNVTVSKRNYNQFKNSTAWQQVIDVKYYGKSTREEALDLIINTINKQLDENGSKGINNIFVCFSRYYHGIYNWVSHTFQRFHHSL